ncbi:putative elongator complex protein 1 [Teleopsis dalmanni]|uniref:putative elongator complex protein 1 n=1 Tax=Teleopsis dalmanni TaxID=139649 RepID=UPI0018CEAF9E|nr:putative elongator complex protein 1 [Teleopsis dalmanni]
MRNLKLKFCTELNAPVRDVKFVVLNPNDDGDSDVVYFVTETKLFSYMKSTEVLKELTELPGIINAEYLALETVISLASESGEVITVDPETSAVTEGTYCDVGLLCMAWSPDQELVVFVTKAHNIVVLNANYDPVEEHSLGLDDENPFVTVGWGSKETQFHGSEGKEAAKKKSDYKLPEDVKQLPQNVEVHWRDDGAYFAVSYVNSIYGRMFKVFNREGKFQFTSEKVNNLGVQIAWRPAESWIAVPHKLPNKSTIGFFEMNGLRHRELILPFDLDVEQIQSLKYSPDSDILAIETKDAAQNFNYLYLYIVNNYHWYLKQTLRFSLNNPITYFNWDNRLHEEKTLHILLEDGKYLIYRWRFCIDKYENFGVVAVIDGNKLLLTDFKQNIIPPPKCNRILQLDKNINACTIILVNQKLLLCVYDVNEDMTIFNSNISKPLNFDEHSKYIASPELCGPPAVWGNFLFLGDGTIVTNKSDNSQSVMQLMKLDSVLTQYIPLSKFVLSTKIYSMADAGNKILLAQADNAEIFKFIITKENTIEFVQANKQSGPVVDQLIVGGSRNNSINTTIAWKTNHNLFINEELYFNDVTSCCVIDNYLIFTKLTTMYFWHLKQKKTIAERKIERGSKIITTVFDSGRVVLQLPRGNIETVVPRILSLGIVSKTLNQLRYKNAMEIVRKERINLNIISDNNIELFLNNLELFLNQIDNPDWLCLFLNDLKNEDFTKTVYKFYYFNAQQMYPENFQIEKKVVNICEKLLSLMEESKNKAFFLPILSAYVKIGKVEKALAQVWKQKYIENLNTDTADSLADKGLQHLIQIVNVDELSDIALGTYDIGLVVYVLQKSHSDPKEFLPFFNELKSYDTNYRCYKIDEHLKRYQKALKGITACGEAKLDEALEFIKKHNLYALALKYYEAHPNCYKSTCLAFGDYLRTNNKLKDASIMYERGDSNMQAFLSAKNILDCGRVLFLAKKNGADIATVALSLVPLLMEKGRYDEAYDLQKSYGNNIIDGVKILLKGKVYNKAICEVRLFQADNNDINLIDSLVLPELLTHFQLLEEKLLEDKKTFENYKERLLEIRKKKLKQQLEGEDADDDNIDECDIISDTTSVSRFTNSSRGTGKTFRSSKNRRKHAKKVLSLKPGNKFEDIALIDALYNLTMKLATHQQIVHDTCGALIELQQDTDASALQELYREILVLIKNSLDEIWIPELMTAKQLPTGLNIDYAELQNEQRYAMIEPVKRFKPELKIFDWEHEILRLNP